MSQENRKKRRHEEEEEEEDEQRPSLRGIKKQARYVPGVPMSRDELTQWRKEARRVRNRESAAASRAKTRERIEYLEGQVEDLQNKYSAALQCLAEMAKGSPVLPSILLQDYQEQVLREVSPASSPDSHPQEPLVAPDVLSLDPLHALDLSPMNSRPTAVSKNHLGNVVSSDSSSNGSDEEVSDKPAAIDDELGSFLWETFSSEDLHLPLSDDTDTLVGV